MTPEEFLQRFESLKAGRPANFNQRFMGDVYNTFAPSPNIDDRRNEGLREGGLGALKAEMLRNSIQGFPTIEEVNSIPVPGPLPDTPIGNQLGIGELDRAIAFNNIQASNDPAVDMAFQFIDNPSGEI